MRSETNLFAAWRHVKRSALNSSRDEIKGQAAEFEHRHQTHLRTIGRQLRDNRFKFDPATGVLKDKRVRLAKGKAPRPIMVGSLRNRVVQRAILQVLQPRRIRDIRNIDSRYEAKRDPRLGNINRINESRYGVGGLLRPYGGVRPAVERILSAINDGSTHFFQSDIMSFFTRIPTSSVIKFIGDETEDKKFAQIFHDGLNIDLANKDELITYARLFPSGGIGVAQGSSLSAFAGNVLLFELDHELNSNGVTAVRYIDDLLMVAPDEKILDNAVKHAKHRLAAFGFELYKPSSGSDKAAKGVCGPKSINFLGCMLQPNRCVPSSKSIDRLNRDVSKIISKSKSSISKYMKQNIDLNPHHSESSTIQSIGKKLFGWQKSFSFCTDSTTFAQLDKDMQRKISDYRNWVHKKCKFVSAERQMLIYGIPQTEKMPLTSED